MEVYKYEKCLLTRLEESRNILCDNDKPVPSSSVQSVWACFIELQIEPAGWQALWKIPRVICEELRVSFPCIVFGNVHKVLFKELKAVFSIIEVEEDNVCIPEKHEVNLDELWPTLIQQNDLLNVEQTADCIDKLRYFYNNIWMPWDNDGDEDVDWPKKHLDTRIRFFFDLKNEEMPRALSAYIRILLFEARYIQKRRELLELQLSDDEGLEHVDNKQITDLMQLHLRLGRIKSEIEIFENPMLRKIYSSNHVQMRLLRTKQSSISNGDMDSKNSKEQIFVVSKSDTVDAHSKLLQQVSAFISPQQIIHIRSTLEDALNSSESFDKIYLSRGIHYVKFLGYLNDNGLISGVASESVLNNYVQKSCTEFKSTVITSKDEDSILLIFDGDFTLENLVLDCRNVRTGIVIKCGNVIFRNCLILGDGKSTTRQGIILYGKTTLKLENCIMQNFSTGIVLKNNSKLSLKSTRIMLCDIGIDTDDDSVIYFENTTIESSKRFGIIFRTTSFNDKIKFQKVCELNENVGGNLQWQGECTFESNIFGNIVAKNKQLQISPLGLSEEEDS